MKNFKYLFVMFFAVMLSVSCSSDDDSGSDLNDSALVGTWGITEIDEGVGVKVLITFNANNSGTSVVTSTFEGEITQTDTENFTWSTSGNKLTISSGGESDVVTYAINGNKLTVTDSDGVVVVFTKQ
jgi:hypothetical protein